MGAIKRMLEDIREEMTFNYDSIEPTDSQGWELAASAEYGGKTWNVDLSGRLAESLEDQAAARIMEEILKEPAPEEKKDAQIPGQLTLPV